jgi:hypothetical protein
MVPYPLLYPVADVRETPTGVDGTYRFLVHDRDGIFAPAVDTALRSMALQVLKTPVHAPQANAHCERFIGTARRECLDWVIPLNERHLWSILAEWCPITMVNHMLRWALDFLMI